MRGGTYLLVPSYSDLSFASVNVFYARNASFRFGLDVATLEFLILGDGNSSIPLLFKVMV